MMPPNFRQVTPTLYRSGAPTVQAQVDWLINGPPQIRKIISLDRNTGMALGRMLPSGIQHVELYIEPYVPASINTAGNRLKAGGGEIFNAPHGGATLVHCSRGIDRTGFAIAIYRVLKGSSPATAIREAESFGYGSGISPEAKTLMNQIIGLPTDISEADDIVTYTRDNDNQGPSSTVARTSNPVIDQTDAARWTEIRSPLGDSYPQVNIRSRMIKLRGLINKLSCIKTRVKQVRTFLKKASDKSAVIIKGMPTPTDEINKFYNNLKKYLMSIGYYVDIVDYNDLPPVADLWISHGKGTEVFKVAPNSVKQLALKPTTELTQDIKSTIEAMSQSDVNDAFLGGGPIGSPTAEELPFGSVPKAPKVPENGMRSNYQGSIPGSNFGGTGGTPGVGGPGGIVDIEPYGLVQF